MKMKTAVITGAASGIGKAFSERFSRQDYGFDELWLLDLNQEAMETVAASLSVKTHLFVLDLSKEENFECIKEALTQYSPQIGILANCAGFGTIGWFSETDMPKQLNMIDVNCRGLTEVTYCVSRILSRGRRF